MGEEVTKICPFCDGEMVKVLFVDNKEIFRCKACGFEATFIKGAEPEAPK